MALVWFVTVSVVAIYVWRSIVADRKEERKHRKTKTEKEY
jgi:membrane protein implicated in regulation of membrane protease activity